MTDQAARTRVLEGIADSATEQAPLIFARGEVVAERFRILGFLGQGGMGQVFEAADLELGGRVALKAIRPELSRHPSSIERFKREIQLARQVTHPNVCRVFDLFQHRTSLSGWGRESPPVLFLTMELVAGETLADRLHRSAPLPTSEALPILRDMAAALDAAHRAGVVHRDFKSANVLLVEEPEGARAVVTDFGLAEASHGGGDPPPGLDRRGSGSVRGTPAYAAPEVVAGDRATPASDVYSFGVVLHEMVTGWRPFDAGALPTLRDASVAPQAAVPPPETPELDPRWRTALRRCLERRPERRYERLADAVESLAGEPAPATPFLRRHPRLSVLSGLMVLLLGVGVGFRYVELAAGPDMATSPAAVPEPARQAVALLGFENLSGRPADDWLSTALVETLAAELAAGEGLRAIPGASVAQMREDLSLRELEALPAQALARVRHYLGTDLVVVGSFARSPEGDGGDLRVEVHLQDAAAGVTIASLGERGREAELFELTARLGRELRTSLDLATPDDSEAKGVRGSLPESPEAARLYARGLSKLRRLELEEARVLFQEAIAKEPQSPRAHSALASTWAELGYDRRAQAAARRAFELSTGLPREERLQIEARYYEAVKDWARARQLYEALWTVFPDTLEYGLRLVAATAAAGDPRAALVLIDDLRRRSGSTVDLRMAEAKAARARGELERQRQASARAAAAAEALGAHQLLARARLLEAEALEELGRRPESMAAIAAAREIYEARGDRRRLAEALVSWSEHRKSLGTVFGVSFEEALEIFRQAGDRQATARTLIKLVRVNLDPDDPRVWSWQREALDLARELGNPEVEAEALNAGAVLDMVGADHDRAIEQIDEAVVKARESGSLSLLAGLLSNSATMHRTVLDYAAAEALFAEAIPIAREVGSRMTFGLLLNNSASLWRSMLQFDAALSNLEEAQALARSMGSQRLLAISSRSLGSYYKTVAELERGERFLLEGAALFDEIGAAEDADWARLGLASVLLRRQQSERAAQIYREIAEKYAEDRGEFWTVRTRTGLADALLALGDVAGAEREIAISLSATLENHEPHIEHWVRSSAALIAAAGGRGEEARLEMERLVAEARGRYGIELELHDRLALGQVLVASGREAEGQAELRAVAEKAREVGLLMIAGMASGELG